MLILQLHKPVITCGGSSSNNFNKYRKYTDFIPVAVLDSNILLNIHYFNLYTTILDHLIYEFNVR